MSNKEETAFKYFPHLLGLQAVTGAFSSFQEGRARKTIARVNAKLARMRAEDALKRGQETEALARQKGKKVIGSQRAALAAQGIRTDFGSSVDVMQETQDITELDALNIRLNAAREAFGHRTEAAGATMQGRLASAAATTRGIDTLLSGGLQAYRAYKRLY